MTNLVLTVYILIVSGISLCVWNHRQVQAEQVTAEANRVKGRFVYWMFLIVTAMVLLGARASADPYEVNNSKITHDGRQINLYGVSWFGFETPDHIVHGLWSRGYKEMIAQMKGLGFNAVRIPFCPATLQNVVITSYINPTKNPDLVGLKSLEVMDRVLAQLNGEKMYILLDHHRPDCETISELWYTEHYTEEMWIHDLKFVADRYKGLGYFMGIDIKNEPHGRATWGTGTLETDWNKAAERAVQAVLAINPDILVFVEGIQENPVCSSSINHWWGGNFEPQKCFPINIFSEKLVFSPHVYGPDVFDQPYFDEPEFPQNMPAIWDTHFGYLIAEDGAVAIGEFGGKYGHGGDPKDVTWQDAIIDYFVEKWICNFFYWSWNPNSTDTGGILQDDWTNIWQDKLDNLKRLMGACNSLSPTIVYVNQGDGTCGGNSPCYTSIQQAIDAANTGTAIRIAQGTYDESFVLNESKSLTLQGGWDSTFTIKPSYTTVNSITISNGTVAVDKLVIQ